MREEGDRRSPGKWRNRTRLRTFPLPIYTLFSRFPFPVSRCRRRVFWPVITTRRRLFLGEIDIKGFFFVILVVSIALPSPIYWIPEEFWGSPVSVTMNFTQIMRSGRFLRSPKRLHGKKKGFITPPEMNDEHSRVFLLYGEVPMDGSQQEKGGVVPPKGFLAVYVGTEMRRYVIPACYLCLPAFRALMEKAAEEFGFNQAGGLRIPCNEESFEELLRSLEETLKKKKSSSKALEEKVATTGRIEIKRGKREG